MTEKELQREAFSFLLQKHVAEAMPDPVGDYLRAMLQRMAETGSAAPVSAVPVPKTLTERTESVAEKALAPVSLATDAQAEKRAAAENYVLNCLKSATGIDRRYVQDITGWSDRDASAFILGIQQELSGRPKSSSALLRGQAHPVPPANGMQKAAPVKAHAPRNYQRSPEEKARISANMKAGHARRRAEKEAQRV